MWAFAGMGFIISVGYMDPGNWATDITAGSSSGYVLLVAVLLASITAMFLQVLGEHACLVFRSTGSAKSSPWVTTRREPSSADGDGLSAYGMCSATTLYPVCRQNGGASRQTTVLVLWVAGSPYW